MMIPLAVQQAPEALSFSGGFSWWQTLGGLALVFGLLMFCLRLLGRFQGSGGKSPANLLAVWSVGPKREVQALRLDDEVHYIYRHDGAMVLLKNQNFQEWEQSQAQKPERSGDRNLLRNWRSWLSLKSPETSSHPLDIASKS